MTKVLLIHWNQPEGLERSATLEKLGYSSRLEWDVKSSGYMRAIRADPPQLILIDLSRLPAHGREFAVALRQTKFTHRIPIVFAGGEPEKLLKVKSIFPDAVYTEWKTIGKAIRQALANPPSDPVRPPERDYSGTPLYKKLAIREGDRVALVNAPETFERTLGTIPDDVEFLREDTKTSDIVILFVTRMSELDLQFSKAERRVRESGKFWIAYPKKASGIKSDITQQDVRQFAMDRNWVDYKVCAIDADWTGFLLGRSRKK